MELPARLSGRRRRVRPVLPLRTRPGPEGDPDTLLRHLLH